MIKRIRILIVEDSEDDAEVLIRHLSKSGYEPKYRRVETAEDMEGALSEPWDIVLADQSLPLFSGREALELLKKRGIDIPLLLVSGVVTEEAGAVLIKAGAHDCVMKDRPARLVPAVERALREVELKRQRKQTADALEKSEERYRRLVEVCPDCLLILRSGSVLFANEAGMKLFGARKMYDLVGKPLAALFDASSVCLLETAIEWAVSRQKTLPLVDYTIVRQDGTRREVEVAAASFSDAQGELVQLVIRDVSERCRLEREIIRISEHEQQRLGQDLHDGVCQKLVGLKFKLAALQASLSGRHVPEEEQAAGLSHILELAIQEAHSLAYGLCPVGLDRKGIVCALRELALMAETVFGITCRVRSRGAASWVNSQIGTELFRIAQESVSNAVKHGRATQIEVNLVTGQKRARLSINDNGSGLGNAPVSAKGMGIQIMHYRAQRIGAKLQITARAHHGTRVVCDCSVRDRATTT